MNLLKTILSTSVFAIASVALHAQLPAKVESFPVRDVRLTASPFKHAEDMDIRYLLGIDPDRLLAPYLKEAGLSPKAENYTNWENTGLDGHIGGHYLSALSYMYAATGNKEIKARLDYMISELKRCQDAAGDGYLVWSSKRAQNVERNRGRKHSRVRFRIERPLGSSLQYS